MKIALDIITVAILLLSIFFGARKGLLKTLLGFVALLLVFILAYKLSVPLGNYVDQKFVNSSFRNSASKSIAEKIGVELTETADGETQLQGFESEVEEYEGDKPLFKVLGISAAAITNTINNAGNSVVTALFNLIDKVSCSVSRVAAFIAILICGLLLLFLLRFISVKLLKAVGLTTLDRVLGGVVGLARGLLLVLLFAFLVRLAMPSLTAKLSEDDVDNTLIFKYSYSIVDKNVPD